MRSRTTRAALLMAPLLLAAASPGDYEPARQFTPKEAVAASRLKNPAYTIGSVVRNDGFLNIYTIQTPFGAFEAHGNVLLDMRLQEAVALSELEKVSKTGVLAKALGRSVVDTGRGVVRFVTSPVETVKGIGGGIKRFGVNLGRKAKRGADKVTHDDDDDPDAPKDKDERSTGSKVGGAAGGAAKAILGVNAARRRWAAKVGVDPYTTNDLMQRTLEEIARVDAAGSIVARIAIPIPVAVGATATISGLVWSKDPEELLKQNETRLRELGVGDEGVKDFLYRNDALTLTTCTIIVEALYASPGVAGRADFVESAANAKDEAAAWFYATSAQQLQRLAAETPVAGLLDDSDLLVARARDGRAVVLLPADYLTWNEQLAMSAPEIAARAGKEMAARSREVRVTGRLSPRAKQELGKLGFGIVEAYRPKLRAK